MQFGRIMVHAHGIYALNHTGAQKLWALKTSSSHTLPNLKFPRLIAADMSEIQSSSFRIAMASCFSANSRNWAMQSAAESQPDSCRMPAVDCNTGC